MKEQVETAVPRSKFVAVDNDEARKTATGHSCNRYVQFRWQLERKVAI